MSNDCDIAEALRRVREQLEERIGLMTSGSRRPSQQLKRHADFERHVRNDGLRHAQLPDPIPGTKIRKPERW